METTIYGVYIVRLNHANHIGSNILIGRMLGLYKGAIWVFDPPKSRIKRTRTWNKKLKL